MTSREQFEAAWEKNNECEPMDGWESLHCDDGYTDEIIDGQWWAWQASREAVEVNPPKFVDSREALSKGFTVDYSKGFGDGMDAYEESIRAAGIKITEGERKNG